MCAAKGLGTWEYGRTAVVNNVIRHDNVMPLIVVTCRRRSLQSRIVSGPSKHRFRELTSSVVAPLPLPYDFAEGTA